MTGLTSLGAVDALTLFRARELSPVELFDALSARVDAHDQNPGGGGATNAVVQVIESGRDAAREAERRYVNGDVNEALGCGETALLGLTIATKEQHGIAGQPLTKGLRGNLNQIADADHPIVERLRAAGGIVHLRTSTPEMSCASWTHSGLWGVTRNPWNKDLTPGGSSGGSGAALAAGYAPLATASDIAGSTRIPAAFCGVVGYKAPYGRVPGAPPFSADWYRGDGAMARSVSDTALIMNVISGIHPIDHSTVPGEDLLPLDYGQAASWLAGKRVALSLTLGDFAVHPDTVEALLRTARVLQDAGAVVEEISLPWSRTHIGETMMAHFGHIFGPALVSATAGMDDLADYTKSVVAVAATASERMSLIDTLASESLIQRQLAEAMRGFDALITPVNAVNGLVAGVSHTGELGAVGPDGENVRLGGIVEAHMTGPFNICNRCPVLTVPIGVGSNGLPIGMQIVGHPYAEESVFRLGAAVEELRPWPLLAPEW